MIINTKDEKRKNICGVDIKIIKDKLIENDLDLLTLEDKQAYLDSISGITGIMDEQKREMENIESAIRKINMDIYNIKERLDDDNKKITNILKLIKVMLAYMIVSLPVLGILLVVLVAKIY